MASALTVRLPNWVGDCIMALPALQALRAQGLELRCLGRGWAPGLLAATGLAVAELPRGRLAAARAMRATGAERALLLTHSLSSALVARLARLPALGYARDGRSLLLSHHRPWPEATHEARRYWGLADAALRWLERDGLSGDPPRCELPLPDTAIAAGHAALGEADAGDAPVVLCPVATGTVHGVDKHWPHFTTLAEHLVAAGTPPVVIAPPGQLDAVRARFPGCHAIGELPIASFAGVLAAAGTVVANDSGPMHIACAVGTRSVIPFAVTDPAITGAWSDHLVPVRGEDGAWPGVDAVLAQLRA